MIRKFALNLWRWKIGTEELPNTDGSVSLDDLSRTEWSDEFEQLCRNRLIIGALRYGRLNAKNKPQYNRIESIRKRLLNYEQTGNTENLVDIANICLCEYVEGNHPNKHFAAIDDGEHVKPM
ncbi:MAG: hypothetical protein KJ941_00895 [Bacteroidetes bacterium]|nr:hypothetical protein [Bacteroidota bacterium]